jgi:hypothetical protein
MTDMFNIMELETCDKVGMTYVQNNGTVNMWQSWYDRYVQNNGTVNMWQSWCDRYVQNNGTVNMWQSWYDRYVQDNGTGNMWQSWYERYFTQIRATMSEPKSCIHVALTKIIPL